MFPYTELQSFSDIAHSTMCEAESTLSVWYNCSFPIEICKYRIYSQGDISCFPLNTPEDWCVTTVEKEQVVFLFASGVIKAG